MKKLVSAALFVMVLVFNANAQDKKFSFGVGPVLSFPMGDLGKAVGIGFGAEAQATYHVSETFEGFAQVGFTSFSGKTIDLGILGSVKGPSIGFLPVLVGARYVSNGLSFGAGLGYGSFSASGASSEGGFAYSPQVGYSFGKIQAIVNYTGVSKDGATNSFLGLKAFYNF